MVIGATAMTICAVAFFVLAILRLSVGKPGSRAGGLAVVVLIVASIGLPILARGLGRPQTLSARRLEIGASAAERYEARVILLAIDGASLDFVSPAAADGRLPNFGRLQPRMHVTSPAAIKRRWNCRGSSLSVRAIDEFSSGYGAMRLGIREHRKGKLRHCLR
jgi:hypothetical protein